MNTTFIQISLSYILSLYFRLFFFLWKIKTFILSRLKNLGKNWKDFSIVLFDEFYIKIEWTMIILEYHQS